MGDVTKIQWTDATFNPWVGCTKVAPGCANCYAEADMDKRRHFANWGPSGTRVRTSASNWKKPLAWNREAEKQSVRYRAFCASLADVFEEWDGQPQLANGQWLIKRREFGRVKELIGCNLRGGNDAATLDDLRRELFAVIDQTPSIDWQLLTKRPENIRKLWHNHIDTCDQEEADIEGTIYRPNIWLGTSVSDQATANKAIPELLKCRDLSPVLFLSIEPLLGPVDLTRVGNHNGTLANLFDGNCLYVGDIGGAEYSWTPRNFLRWVIVGGESGPNARPCRPEWIRSIVQQCKDARVPCFVKQMGGNVVTRNDMIEDAFNSLDTGWPDPQVEYDIHEYREEYQGADCRIHLRDKKGGDPAEWPEDLRVRQFPR